MLLAAPPFMIFRGLASTIDRTLGTNIGDMTNAGGLAIAFDGDTNQSQATGAKKTSVSDSGEAYIGKTLASPTAIESVTVHGSNNHGWCSSGDPDVTIQLRGKQGAAPSNGTDGALLGSITFTDSSDESGARSINSSDTTTYWDHVFIRITRSTGPGDINCAELVMTGWA